MATDPPESTPGEAARSADGKFAPGVSGNPGGRAKDLRQTMKLIREEHLPDKVPNLLRKLYFMAMGVDGKKPGDKPGPGNVFAAKEYLNRVLGMPTQALELSGPDGEPIQSEDRTATMTSEQKIQRMFELMGKAGWAVKVEPASPQSEPSPDGEPE